jgi:hypothetical protein
MRPATVAEKLGLRLLAALAALLLAACTSDHHVSPWGTEAPLAPFFPRPDLGARLAQIEAETSRYGRVLETDIAARLPGAGGPLRILGYRGVDAIGRPVTAVRVATERAVAMAVGPLDLHDAVRDQATELVPALVPGPGGGAEGGAYPAGTDLNGDGTPDVVLRNEAGVLEIWRVGSALGATRYDVEIAASPTRAAFVAGDGRVDLVGEAPIPPGDPVAPHLDDVATFEGGRYSDRTEAAREYHARALQAVSALPAPGPQEHARKAIERAWHALLAGRPGASVLKELAAERAPEGEAAAFAAWSARIEDLAKRLVSSSPPSPPASPAP